MSKTVFLAIGSPLIDIIAVVNDECLKKYEMKPNNAIVAKQIHTELFEELINNHKSIFQAGGCALNTTRILQRILNVPEATAVMGAIGNDSYGKILKEKLKEDNVQCVFEVVENETTGKCGVLLTGNNRSLCTDLGASKLFNIKHLSSKSMWCVIEEAEYYYIPGFLLGVSIECVMTIAQHSLNRNKTFAFNLSAPFIMETYKEEILNLIPFVDILFGNEAEARAFARVNGYQSRNLKDILLYVNGLQTKNHHGIKMTVITRSAHPVCLVRNGKFTEYPVRKLEETQIKDTNAAGDAFVGGFLAAFIMKQSIASCVNQGINAAAQVIQNIGCNFH